MPALNGVTSTGPSTAIDNILARPRWQITATWTGNPSAVVVNLEGSSDNATWTTLATISYPLPTQGAGTPFGTAPSLPGSGAYCHSPAVTSGTAQSAGIPARYVRANLATLSGGSSPTVSAWIEPLGNDVNGP